MKSILGRKKIEIKNYIFEQLQYKKVTSASTTVSESGQLLNIQYMLVIVKTFAIRVWGQQGSTMRDLQRKLTELKDVKDEKMMKLKNFRPSK